MNKTLFRPHRGSLSNAMAEAIEVEDKDALIEHIKSSFSYMNYPYTVDSQTVVIKPYGYDERIHWDTHIVTLTCYGVLGFTNGNLT